MTGMTLTLYHPSGLPKVVCQLRLVLQLLEGKITDQLPGGKIGAWYEDHGITNYSCQIRQRRGHKSTHRNTFVILRVSFTLPRDIVSWFDILDSEKWHATDAKVPCFSGRVHDNFIEARMPRNGLLVEKTELHEVMAVVDKTTTIGSPLLRRAIYA